MSEVRRMQWAAGLVVGAAILAVGCGSKTEQPTESKAGGDASSAPSGKAAAVRKNALVRVVNAVGSSKGYDIWFGDTKAFSAVGYKKVTPYQELPGERHEFKLRAAGAEAGKALATNSEGLSDGQRYTVVALTTADGKPDLRVFNDDLTAPDAGKAKVRVIHAAGAAGEADVVPAGSKEMLFDGVNVDTATSYKSVDPMKATLDVRKSGKMATALRIPKVDLEAGKIYTIVVAQGVGKKLDAIKIEDQLVPAA